MRHVVGIPRPEFTLLLALLIVSIAWPVQAKKGSMTGLSCDSIMHGRKR